MGGQERATAIAIGIIHERTFTMMLLSSIILSPSHQRGSLRCGDCGSVTADSPILLFLQYFFYSTVSAPICANLPRCLFLSLRTHLGSSKVVGRHQGFCWELSLYLVCGLNKEVKAKKQRSKRAEKDEERNVGSYKK